MRLFAPQQNFLIFLTKCLGRSRYRQCGGITDPPGRGHPHSAHECVNQLRDLRGDRKTKNDKSPVCCRFPEGVCPFILYSSMRVF